MSAIDWHLTLILYIALNFFQKKYEAILENSNIYCLTLRNILVVDQRDMPKKFDSLLDQPSFIYLPTSTRTSLFFSTHCFIYLYYASLHVPQSFPRRRGLKTIITVFWMYKIARYWNQSFQPTHKFMNCSLCTSLPVCGYCIRIRHIQLARPIILH